MTWSPPSPRASSPASTTPFQKILISVRPGFLAVKVNTPLGIAPSVIGMFMAARIEQRIESLKERQTSLVEEWGPGVAGKEDDASNQDQASAASE